MTVSELLALFALFGVPILPAEADTIRRAELRYRLPPGLLPAVCVAMTRARRLRIPFDPELERPRDLVCAPGQTVPGGAFLIPTAVQGARDLVVGLNDCGGPEGALRYVTVRGCRRIRGNWEGRDAVRYYRRILALRHH